MSSLAETESTPPPPAKQTPVWEDLPDIFFEPTSVFARRSHGRFGSALLILLLLLGVLGAASTWALRPAQQADQSRIMARMAQNNPELQARLAEQPARQPGVGSVILGGVSTALMIAVSVFLIGIFAWLIGKIFGSTATIAVGVMIATYAMYPRIVQSIVMILQGLFLDPAQLDSMMRVSASPARFLDPDTTPMTTLLLVSRLDLFVLWSTVLIGVGMYVAGRLPKGQAAAVALLVWLLGALPVIIPALLFG